MESQQQSRAPELRKDVVTNRWVIFSPARSERPSDFKSKNPTPNLNRQQECPFCIGHEHECAPEIFRIPLDNRCWKLRVIQNLYPALDRNLIGRDDKRNVVSGNEVVLPGAGFHDVVIETPVHWKELKNLAAKEVGDVILAYKKRVQQILKCEGIKYVQVFKNHGASAGASMSHSHSQIIALPVIPPLVSARLSSMKENFDLTGKCALCDIQSKDLLIDETINFISAVPFAATFPFEMWIIPRGHAAHFHELDGEKAAELGSLLKLLLQKMAVQLNNPPYNFMIQTSPLHVTKSEAPYMHWFLQIVPQLSVAAGFEIGTGCHINPVFPEDAAKILREIINLQPDESENT